MKIKQCRFILNTLNQALEKQNMPIAPKIHSSVLANSAASANPYTVEITLNKIYNCRLLRPLLRKFIKHEMKHIDQFQIIARYIAGLAGNIDAGLNNFKKFIVKKQPMYAEGLNFNKEFYKKTIARQGVIKEGHPLYNKAKEYVNAFKEYPFESVFDYLEVYSEKGLKEMIKLKKKNLKLYKNNLLEVEARKASKE